MDCSANLQNAKSTKAQILKGVTPGHLDLRGAIEQMRRRIGAPYPQNQVRQKLVLFRSAQRLCAGVA